MKTKIAALLLSMTALTFQFNNCARFLGDLAGDAFWLRGID